jgi:hypothetical protein
MKKFFAAIFLFGLFTLSAQNIDKKFLGEWLSSGNEDTVFVSCTFNSDGTCIIRRSIYSSISFKFEVKDNLVFIDGQGYYFAFYNKKNTVLVLTPAFGEASQIIQMVKL